MTVQELIVKLSELNPNLEVRIADWSEDSVQPTSQFSVEIWKTTESDGSELCVIG